jgi:hypothetical protein
LKEFAGFPAGVTWYYVVYDETREIGLPPEIRSSEWKAKHSKFSHQNDPAWTTEAIPLDGDFFLFIEVL